MILSPTSKKHIHSQLQDEKTKYFTAPDICYLHFEKGTVDCNYKKWEFRINKYRYFKDSNRCDTSELIETIEVKKGRSLVELNDYLNEVITELHRRHDKMRKNAEMPYRMIVFTNNLDILEFGNCKGFLNLNNLRGLNTAVNKAFRGNKICLYSDDFDFRLASVFCLNREEEYCKATKKRKTAFLEYLMQELVDGFGVPIHKVEYSLGRFAKRMNERLYNDTLTHNCGHKLLHDKKGKTVKENNIKILEILQSVSCAGILKCDEPYKISRNVSCFDISSAYQYVMCCEPIFPATPLRLIPMPISRNWRVPTAEEIKNKMLQKINDYINREWWYIMTIHPNYKGEDNTVLRKYSKYLRRECSKKHKDYKPQYIDDTQILNFTMWDIQWLHKNKLLEEVLTDIIEAFSDLTVDFVIAEKMDYLPKGFRLGIFECYKEKQAMKKGIEKDIFKTVYEQTYGKALQFRYINDATVANEIKYPRFNIACALTCCAYTRFRMMTDFLEINDTIGYRDTDGIKQTSGNDKDILKLFKLVEEENNYVREQQRKAQLPESELGTWKYEYCLDYFMPLGEKLYLGKTTKNEKIIALAGCKKDAYEKYFKNRDIVDVMNKTLEDKKITIPNGIVKKQVTENFLYEKRSAYTIEII